MQRGPWLAGSMMPRDAVGVRDLRGSLPAWQGLRAGSQLPSGDGVPAKLAGVSTGAGPVRLALATDGTPRLLLPVEADDTGDAPHDREALTVRRVTLSSRGVPQAFLELRCTDLRLEQAFADVCDALLSRIEMGEPVFEACEHTLDGFEALFRRSGTAAPDQRVVRGLVGELLYLDELLSLGPEALGLWRGHHGEPHDFRGARLAVEIKTVHPSGDGTVTISSLGQLEPPTEGRLHLRVIELAECEGGTVSVANLVSRISERLVDTDPFLEALRRVGCEHPDEGAWASHRFEPGRALEWRVADGFPRIVRTLPGLDTPGLVDASYVIRPRDAPASCTVDPDGQRQMMEKLLECTTPS